MDRLLIYALQDPTTLEVRYIGKSSSGGRKRPDLAARNRRGLKPETRAKLAASRRNAARRPDPGQADLFETRR